MFAYLELIREAGIEPRYYDELADMARIGFRFQQKSAPRSFAVSLASALHVYPVHEVLSAPYRFDEFDPALERRFLAALVPGRVLVTVMAKGLATDAVTPFHETPYRLSAVSPETLARWRDPAPDGALALPEPNPFVPGEPALIDAPSGDSRPARIVQRPGFELWHDADVSFGQPRTNFYFAVRSPVVNDSPRHAVLSSLFVRMTNDALNEFAYPASLAGQSYSLYRHRRGISVRLSGWSDKQDLLLARIVSTLRDPPLPARRFEAEKAEYVRQLRNVDERRPFRRAMSDMSELLTEPAWSDDALLAALEAVTLEDLREYAARFFERGEIVALAHGNVTAGDAKALGGVLERGLARSMTVTRVTHGRVVKLDPGTRYLRWLASEHEDHALAVYRQARGRDFAERAKIALIVQATGNRFFHELRTEREIGYIVFATFMPMLDVPGLALVVQSPSNPPETLHRHVDSFLERIHGGASRHAGRGLRAPPRRGGELAAGGGDAARRAHRPVLERDRPRELRVRPARAAAGGVARGHPGRAGGRLARPGHRPGDRPRSGRRGLGRRASRLRAGVPGRRAGGGCGDVQGRATVLRRLERRCASDRRGVHGGPPDANLPGASYPSQPRTFRGRDRFASLARP